MRNKNLKEKGWIKHEKFPFCYRYRSKNTKIKYKHICHNQWITTAAIETTYQFPSLYFVKRREYRYRVLKFLELMAGENFSKGYCTLNYEGCGTQGYSNISLD